MTIRTAEDMGNVWYDSSADEVYLQLDGQPTSGAPDTTGAPADVLNISGTSFQSNAGFDTAPYDDSWTAEQNAVVLHKEESFTAEITWDCAPNTTSPLIMTVPAASAPGELRIWVPDHPYSHDNTSLQYVTLEVDGQDTGDNLAWDNGYNVSRDQLSEAVAHRVAGGEEIRVTANQYAAAHTYGIAVAVRPDVYP